MSIYPADLPKEETARLEGLIEQAFDVLQVRHTPDLVDAMVDCFDDLVDSEKEWGR